MTDSGRGRELIEGERGGVACVAGTVVVDVEGVTVGSVFTGGVDGVDFVGGIAAFLVGIGSGFVTADKKIQSDDNAKQCIYRITFFRILFRYHFLFAYLFALV